MAHVADQAFLGLEQLLNAVQHVVEGGGQAADLAGIVGDLDALAQVARAGDGAGGIGNGVDRLEGAPGQESAHDGGQNQADDSTQDQITAHLGKRGNGGLHRLDDLDCADDCVIYEQRCAVDEKTETAEGRRVILVVFALRDVRQGLLVIGQSDLAEIDAALENLAVEAGDLHADRVAKQPDFGQDNGRRVAANNECVPQQLL